MEQRHYDPSSGLSYENHVTTFPYSPHYNLKALTIAHFIVSKYVFKCECFLCVLLCVSKNNAIIFFGLCVHKWKTFYVYILFFAFFVQGEKQEKNVFLYIFYTFLSSAHNQTQSI